MQENQLGNVQFPCIRLYVQNFSGKVRGASDHRGIHVNAKGDVLREMWVPLSAIKAVQLEPVAGNAIIKVQDPDDQEKFYKGFYIQDENHTEIEIKPLLDILQAGFDIVRKKFIAKSQDKHFTHHKGLDLTTVDEDSSSPDYVKGSEPKPAPKPTVGPHGLEPANLANPDTEGDEPSFGSSGEDVEDPKEAEPKNTDPQKSDDLGGFDDPDDNFKL